MSTTALASPLVGAASWRDVATLLKLRIGALVVVTALAGAVAAGGRSASTLFLLAVACLAASSGASALNHYLDRDLDARMARTAGRPLPSRRVSERTALWLGVGLVAASQAAGFSLGWGPALYLLAGAATYAVVYTAWLKRRTPYSIVIGGAAGSFAALAGWETAASTWAPAPQLLAAVLLLWTPSHFWSLAIVLERDYRAAGVPALSAVVGAERTAQAVWWNTVGLVACSLLLGAYVGLLYLAIAVPAGVGFLVCAYRLRRAPVEAEAWRTFKLSGVYLLAVLAALVVSVLA